MCVVFQRQLLFVYEPEFESGGLLWPKIYNRMAMSLYLLQVRLRAASPVPYRL
jgi:hypothetical protein